MPCAVGAASDGQRDMRREVDEVAGEQFDIGVDRAEFDLSRLQDARQCMALRPGIGKIELLCDAFLEQVDVLGQHDAGLHDVQIVQHFRIGFGQTRRQKVRLLLVVAFEADAISGPDHRLEQRGRMLGATIFPAANLLPAARRSSRARCSLLPVSHFVHLLLTLPCRAAARIALPHAGSDIDRS